MSFEVPAGMTHMENDDDVNAQKDFGTYATITWNVSGVRHVISLFFGQLQWHNLR